jgi:hypothetical protein
VAVDQGERGSVVVVLAFMVKALAALAIQLLQFPIHTEGKEGQEEATLVQPPIAVNQVTVSLAAI